MPQEAKIIIVEDNDTFREGLILLLHTHPHYIVIAEVPGFPALEKLNIIPKADLILMDLMMPDMNGFDAAKSILWDFPRIPILAITMFTDKAYLRELMSAGFKGCVFKSNIYGELETAMQTILNGKLYFPKDIQI